MVNIKVRKTSVSAKKSPKQKRIIQKKKQSERKITSSEKQQRGKKAATKKLVTKKPAIKKPAKGTTNKRIKTRVTVQKKPSKKNLNKGVYKEKDTLKIRRTNISELNKVEDVIEKLSKKPEPYVRVTVPGVLRMTSSVPNTVPGDQKAIPIVEIKNYLKKLLVGNDA